MLLDDANIFDHDMSIDHDTSIDHDAGKPLAKGGILPLDARKLLSSRGESSLQRVQEMARIPFTPGQSTWTPPTVISTAPRLSAAAHAEMLRNIDEDAPREVLARLRELARQRGTTGIAAWRLQREHEQKQAERNALEALTAKARLREVAQQRGTSGIATWLHLNEHEEKQAVDGL